MENNMVKTYLGDNLSKGPYMTSFSEMKISHDKVNVFSSTVKINMNNINIWHQ